MCEQDMFMDLLTHYARETPSRGIIGQCHIGIGIDRSALHLAITAGPGSALAMTHRLWQITAELRQARIALRPAPESMPL